MAEAVAKKSKLDNGPTVSLRAPSVVLAFPSLGLLGFTVAAGRRRESVPSDQGQIGNMRQLMSEIETERQERRGPILFLGGMLIGLYIVYMLVMLVSQSA